MRGPALPAKVVLGVSENPRFPRCPQSKGEVSADEPACGAIACFREIIASGINLSKKPGWARTPSVWRWCKRNSLYSPELDGWLRLHHRAFQENVLSHPPG